MSINFCLLCVDDSHFTCLKGERVDPFVSFQSFYNDQKFYDKNFTNGPVTSLYRTFAKRLNNIIFALSEIISLLRVIEHSFFIY
jgi:hypothetical protein